MMFESLIRHPMRLLIGLVVLIVLLSQTLTIVPEDKQALVLRFGEIERMKNVYRPGERFGASGAGLLVRMPLYRKSTRLNPVTNAHLVCRLLLEKKKKTYKKKHN